VGVAETVVPSAIPAMWIAWIGYWLVAARRVKPTRWQEGIGASTLHGVPFCFCMLLLVAPFWTPAVLRLQLWSPGPILPVTGTALVAAGLSFAVWARVHLAGNWSSRVVVKEDHALVRGGPYRWVRHPIYSGMLLGLAGTALAIGEWRPARTVVRPYRRVVPRPRRGSPDERDISRIRGLLPPHRPPRSGHLLNFGGNVRSIGVTIGI
jgi:protein-S-isoprenylcysteine O-methyltransferase Ste14